MNSPCHAHARRRWASLILMLLLLAAARVSAQSLYYPDQPLPENLFLPLIHIHGLSDTTFFIGGEMATNPASGHIRDLWQFAGDSLGLNAMEFRGEYPMHKMDTLFPDSVTKGNRRLMCWIDKVSWESAWGRQVTFYPFDYAESYYWPCKFLMRSGGTLKQNAEVRDDHKDLASEQVYDSSNTTPGATVAQQIVFGYDPMQTNRYPNHAHYQLTQNGETIIHNNHFNFGQASWYIAVTGHLFDPTKPGGGGAIDSDSLLAIDIYNEVPKDSAYLDSATPVIIYFNKARTIDTAIIDSVIHTEVWDVATKPDHPSLTPTIIPATSRAAFLASITAMYAPTRIIVHDSTLPDINFASFNDSATEHNDPYWRLVSLHARRDTVFQHHLEEGVVRDNRIRRITGTYNFHRHRTPSDTAFLYKTIFVRKADLPPVTVLGQPDYNTYRTPSYQLNLARERGGMSGPADVINGLARFDIRVRWTGKEKVALRSVAIRDTLGEMLLGDGPTSVAYRQEVVDSARSLYYGTAHPSPTALPRETIPLAYFGDEPVFSEYAGFNAIDRLLRDSTAPGGDTTRSLRPHYEINQLTPHKVLISRSPLVEPGFYPSSAGDDHGCDVFGLDHFYFQPPSLRMHDGGKWNVPWLGETADSVELFEKAFQRATIDEYNPGLRSFPFERNKLTDLGIAAHAASRTGRWLIPWVGVHGQVNFKWINTGGVASLEPDMQWIMEAAQVRLMCNLALCYGARGVHYAWVGSDTNETLDQKTPIDANHPHMFGTNFGPLGFFTDRTADRVSPFVVRIDTLNSTTHQFNGVTSSIASFYTGWGVRLREMKWLDKTWFPSVGKQMLKLRWRDGYSIHFTEPQSYLGAIEYQTDHRPLPSTEIVTAVQSWKPSINDAPIQIDPPAKTYVELGFFNTVKGIDTTNRMLDQNYVFVVNRRVFERPDDTSAASAYGKKLDSLAETRTISLKLNLPHPDQSGYNFLHITEIAPDTVALPLIGARHGLDTIVYGDSTVNLTLRPGGGALLRITYAPPSTSFTGGDIRYNNQRKMVFDGRRYHACYYKPITYRYPFDKGNPLWKSLTGSEDAVFYRRSFPMTDTTGGIRWEPVEYLVSDTTADSTVRQNRFPSMSVRVQGDRNGQGTVNGDTVVTIVWSRYKGPGARSVCLRNVRSNGNGAVQISNRPETVGLFSGYYDGKSGEPAWGTPVVSRLDGGELIAWSDSAQGICARVRTLGSGTYWWQWLATNVRYTPVFVVSSPAIVPAWSPSPPGVCMFPSLPASAHVRGLDSNVGIVWQDMRPNFTIRIDYARLVHRMFGGQDWMAVVNPHVISQGGGHFNVHPSIDAAQDVWFDAQEMVTWENHSVQYLRVKAPGFKEMDPQWLDFSSIHSTSLYTPTIRTVDPLHPGNTSYWNPFWDDIKPTQQWTYSVDNRFIISNTGLSRYIDYYPSISSLNGRDSMHQNEKIYFSLATSAIANAYNHEPMAQSIQQYAIHDPAELYTYLHGGNHVNGAASPTRQPLREAMLYEIPATATDLQTTRQFFAKLHPTGYTARGRQLGIPVNDTLVTGYSVGLYNVWTADNSTTHPLAMISYPDTVHRTDSLAMVQSLMRTEDFHAHDSTEISLSYYSGIYGDSTAIDSTRLTLVAELVDSATGMVVQPLDSMTVSDTAGTFYRVIDSVVDLMSGTYFVRVRIVPQNLPALAGMNDSRFPVAEIAGYIGDSLMGKLRHIDAVTGGTGRLSVHPNPTSGRAEILFSVPEQEQAAVTIYDAFGRRIVQPLEGTMEAGRYAIDLNGGALPPGTYMVEFRYGEKRLVEKLVVVR